MAAHVLKSRKKSIGVIFYPYFKLLSFLCRIVIEIGPFSNCKMACKCSSERKSRTSLTLNQKLEMIKLSEKGMSNAEIGRQLGLLRQTVSQVVNAKEKYLKEIKNSTPANTRMIRKRNSLIADMEKVLVDWINDQTGQNIPLSQRLIQNKAQTIFNSMKAERGQEAAKETFGASRGWFMRFKERSRLINMKGQVEAAGADVEAAASYPEELATIINDGGYTKERIFSVDETALYWRTMSSRTFRARQKSMYGFKASEDGQTLLFGANAADDVKSIMNDDEGIKMSVDEVTTDVETAREQELERIPEDVSESLQSHDKPLTDEQRKTYLKVKFTSGKGAMDIVELTTKDLEYYISIVDEAVTGFERIDSNFERSAAVGKMLSNSIECYRKIVCKRKSQSIQ